MKYTLSGSLFNQVRANCIQHIGQLPTDKPVTVEIKPAKRTRSLKQNSTLFGLLYPHLMEFIGLRGDQEAQELHQFFCGEWFGWHEYEIMGRRKVRPKRTTTTDEQGKRDVLSTLAFIEFCEFIKQRAAEQGCVLPDPDPMHFLKDER